jgi:cytochrome oxidase assembly protein ShyY1
MSPTPQPGAYRFALRPAWMLSHLLVLGLILATLSAGFWQLDRLDQRREANQLVQERAEIAVQPLDAVLAETEELKDLAFRQVSVRGTFRSEHEYLISNRTFDSSPGFWVFTPLVTADGRAVIVNRGFIARAIVQQELDDFDAPEGEVEVSGLLFESVGGGRFAQGSEFKELSRPDVAQMQTVVHETLAPMYLQLTDSNQQLPVALDPPDRGEGPHFSYAVQWFIFMTIGVIGYPLVLRRIAGGGKKRVGVTPPLDEPGEGA